MINTMGISNYTKTTLLDIGRSMQGNARSGDRIYRQHFHLTKMHLSDKQQIIPSSKIPNSKSQDPSPKSQVPSPKSQVPRPKSQSVKVNLILGPNIYRYIYVFILHQTQRLFEYIEHIICKIEMGYKADVAR